MFIEPVFGKKFFGREEVLATLHKRVNALKGGYRQNLALTGPMLAGKSSILRHFLKNIKDPDVIPLYIEMTGEDFNVFCRRLMASLLFHYLRSLGVKADPSFDDLKDICREIVPATVASMDDIHKALKQRKYDDAYEKLLSLTSVFKKETGKSCIVILDEFHYLSNFRLKRPFQTFGKFIMVQKNTMYIVSSSQKTLLREILSRKLSLLFGNFEVIEVNGFDNQTARSFISDKINNATSTESVKNYIIQVSRRNPFYLEVLAHRFTELAKRGDVKRDDKECMLDAFAELLYSADGILNQYFTNNMSFFLEKKSRKKFIPVLVSLAKGNSTIKAVQDDLGRADKDMSGKLRRLQHMDLVYNSGVFYRIDDKLFEYWLRNVYALKTRSEIDDLDIKYLEFKRSIDEDYSRYCEFCSKNVTDVLCDLFSSFRNEKVRISMNDRIMPQFEKVKSRPLSDNVHEIAGCEGNRKWVCHVKQNDIADENDIYNLWAIKPGAGSEKITRKIFMPLKRIEHNAYLLAKEQNIWVWDIQQMNDILRLYGKFELVL